MRGSHEQRLLSREILVAAKSDLHIVRTTKRFLTRPRFAVTNRRGRCLPESPSQKGSPAAASPAAHDSKIYVFIDGGSIQQGVSTRLANP
ncbi:hypothetical protein LX36DRAFT_714462 [Colletotrichum falcatum]|nr:hypothetical protein LX36DRAFT_714462 [Colletotrichum falcatum]